MFVRPLPSLFKITAGLREKHSYWRDPAFDGDYLMRLPDRTLVYAKDYDQALEQYHQRKAKLPVDPD